MFPFRKRPRDPVEPRLCSPIYENYGPFQLRSLAHCALGYPLDMKLVLSHTSALDLIRTLRWRGKELQPAYVRTLDDCACSLGDIQKIVVPAFDQSTERLEVLANTNAHQQKSRDHVVRVLKVQPIAGMFCKVRDKAYVTSPEMTFVQMATRLDIIDLLLLGMEFCGSYAYFPNSTRSDKRPPITSKRRLVGFCSRAASAGVRGATTALKAARLIVDNSNSPAETSLVLYLCLPVRMGGYGFPYPSMNPEDRLGKHASSVYGYSSMRCDLHWIDEHVVVEYDSDQEHLSSQSASNDARRRNLLNYKDTTVFTVRKPIIASQVAFDAFVKELAPSLGRHLRPRIMEFTKVRFELRNALFPWLANQRYR